MSERTYWIATALRVATRRNIACWLELFLPAAVIASAIAAGALLILRSLRMQTEGIWTGFGAALLLAAVACVIFARRKFFNVTDALVRIDDVAHFHNRLTAANSGVGDWPARRAVRDPARWNFARLFLPLMLSALLLTGAARLHISDVKTPAHIDEPVSFSRVESLLETLQKSELVDPQALEKVREQLDDLRKQSADNWYDQSSLEAGDTLRQQTEQALKEMQRNLQSASDLVEAAEKLGATLPPGQLKQLDESLQKAIRGLEMGNLPLNKELLGNLKKFDPSKLKQMSAEQIAELREHLKSGEKVCEQCVGVNPQAKGAFLTQHGAPGGRGGGGPSVPLDLKNDATNLHGKETQSVSNDDLSRAMPGDVLGISKGTHEVKKTNDNTPVAGGAISSTGQGGDAVWRDSLTPQEREVLQRYFK